MVFWIIFSILLWCFGIPNFAKNLKMSTNIKSEYKQIAYTLISCPL
jgi:type III secretory pathway component EscU